MNELYSTVVQLLSPVRLFVMQWTAAGQAHIAFTISLSLLKLMSIELVCAGILSLSRVRLFETPWIATYQASLSLTLSQSLLKLMSIESMVPSNHLILYHPLLLLPSVFPSIRAFPVSQFFASGGQSIGASASASVLPMNIQG